MHLFCLGGDPWTGGGGFGSLWLGPASRLAISWLRQPACGLMSVNRLTAPTDQLLIVKSCRLTGVCYCERNIDS